MLSQDAIESLMNDISLAEARVLRSNLRHGACVLCFRNMQASVRVSRIVEGHGKDQQSTVVTAAKVLAEDMQLRV